MGNRFYKGRWVTDEEYNDLEEYSHSETWLVITMLIPTGILAYLGYITFESYKAALIAGGVGFVACFFFMGFIEKVADWLRTLFGWVLVVGVLICVGGLIYWFYTELPN